MNCCERPLRVRAPVDRVLAEQGLRMRRLPGEVCLRCHDITVPAVEPGDSLARGIAACARGKLDIEKLLILKTRPRKHRRGSSCPQCASASESCFLDVALGDRAGLVLENVDGWWCWNCFSGTLAAADEVSRRVSQARFLSGALAPSLLYDTPGYPRSVQFEITTRCNLRCAYCTNSILSQKQDISFDRFMEVVGQVDLTKVDNIDFTGLGEAILHPRLPEMISTVRHRGTASHIRLVSNGTLLTPERFVPLCEAGLTSLAISIDSMDPARFARSRGGARLDIVLRNLRDLADYRRAECQSLSLKIKAVLIEDPYAEAAAILDYSARIGLDMPHFSCLDARRNAREFYHESWLQRHWTAEDDGVFMQWADAEWSRLGGKPPRPDTELGTVTDRRWGFHHPMLLPQDVCRWAVDAAFIGAGGACIACCEQMLDVPRTTWGAVGKKSLAEIWQSEMLWGYRLPLVVGRVPSGCVGCSRAPEHGIAMDCVESPRSDQTIQPA